jgi:flagellar motility protein MotE (MotC chaperone)
MMKLLVSPWMATLVSVLVYLGATVAFWKTPTPPPPVAQSDAAAAVAKPNGPSWDFINPEADQLIAELRAEKKSLVKKEQDLNDLSVRLQSERAELNLVTQSVRQLQTDFDQNVLRITAEETANLKKLAKDYADMDPANAATILQEMDDTSVIKIMVFMKDVETAAIWEAMAKKGQPQAKRAALLSERMRLTVSRNTEPAK